jgi:hypothetical protein
MKAFVFAAAILVVCGLFVFSSADKVYAQFGVERLLRGTDPEQVQQPTEQPFEPASEPETNVVSPDTVQPPTPVPPPNVMDNLGNEPSAPPGSESVPNVPGDAPGETN